MTHNALGFYKLSNLVITPEFATLGSAAFDIRLFLEGTAIEAYDEFNTPVFVDITEDNKLFIVPNWRYKLPTGLIFDIPEGYRLDINLRGGTAFKMGLILSNGTGIVDWDYVNELYIPVTNTSRSSFLLENGDRIAQAKLEKNENYNLSELENPPNQKTERNGGFHSTGVK